jgi:tetratricopeptide (TPR) repeat protein
LEIESFGLCEEFCDMAFANCIDKESLMCAFFYLVAGTLYRRIGLSGKAYDSFLQMLHIRELHLPGDDRDVMGAYSSVSLALTGIYRGEEALAYMGHVFEHLDGKPEDEILKRWNPDRFLRNRGRTYYLLNQFDKAIKDFEKAEYYQTKIHGEDSHYH